MPSKKKSSRAPHAVADSASSETSATVLNAAPMDAPPSFLEKNDRSAPEAPVPHGERSNLQLYLQEIGKTPLLTIEDEVRLAKRIRRGDKAARDHMISANLRLVVKIAMDYKDFGLPLLDLISEGNIGLVKAVERFDLERGASLSSAAMGLVLVMALLGIARYFLYVLMGVVIIHVVTSWVGQGSPMGPVVDALAKPLYRPFRRFIPPMGNIDLTPLVVVVLIQVGLIMVAGATRALVMPVLPQ